MKTSEIFLKSLKIRDELKKNNDFSENPIDNSLLPVLPFRISNKIKLIIIGQDPTVKNPESRKFIEYSLNLDKPGALRTYLGKICDGLGISFENIYATNIFKYFYKEPPARTPQILMSHLEKNIELLQEEISSYPKVPIITLGLPVLQLIVDDNAQVNYYWAYKKNIPDDFDFCKANENKLGRDFFPFPHQPSYVGKVFYNNTINYYLNFMKSNI
jgi:uracil-DNA glycosylase